MRVLVTGGTGWIGSHVVKALVAEGHEVHLTVRSWTNFGLLGGLEKKLRVWGGRMDRIPFIEPDLLLHLAWYTVPGKYLEAPENEECLRQSETLLKGLSCRAVVAGTCFELDTRLGRLSEASPVRPMTLYARSKDRLRQIVEARPNSAYTRFFYEFGPYENEKRLVPTIIRNLLKGDPVKLTPGEQARDFLHVEDVAWGMVKTGFSSLTGVVHVGSGKAIKQREMATILAEAVGRPDLLQFGAVPYFEGEPMLIEADNMKLRSTGWEPLFDIEKGLKDTLDWWRMRSDQNP